MFKKFESVQEVVTHTYKVYAKCGNKNPSKLDIYAFILSAFTMNKEEKKELQAILEIQDNG